MKVVFITESSYEIGLGHLKRCLSLAFEFEKDKVFNIEIILPECNEQTHKILEDYDFTYHPASVRLDFLMSLEKSMLILIVDVKTGFFDGFLKQMFEKSVLIFGIDDLSHRNVLYTVNYSPPAAVIPDTFDNEQREKNYIGWEWIPIHKPFAMDPLHRKKRKENGTLLLFGGSDPEKLSAPSFDYFGKNLPENDFNLICGPLMKPSAIDKCKQISKKYKNLRVTESPENLSALMNDCFYSVTTFGHTFYELIAHGNNPLAIYRDINDVIGLFSAPDIMVNNLISIADYIEMISRNDPDIVSEFWHSKNMFMSATHPSVQVISNKLIQGSINIKTMITNLI